MGATISVSQWYVYGKRHFTKTGYLRHIKNYTEPVQDSAEIGRGAEGADGVDMEGKVIAITGANSGIGKEMATYAAAKGAMLYMLCRSKGKAEKAREEIIEITKADPDKIKILLVDVGELSQVRRVASELQALESKLDCLVCNAGALFDDRRETSEGNEVTFAAHLLGGSYLLSKLLLPQLETNDGRVVFVTSGGMYITKFPDWETVTSTGEEEEKYDGQFAYGYAKRGQVLLAERLTAEYPKVLWVTAHPGWASTGGVDDAFGDNKKYLEPMRNGWQGAEGIAWLMHTDKSNVVGGELYLDRMPQRKHIAGTFMREGNYTKNKEEDVDQMMAKLKEYAGI